MIKTEQREKVESHFKDFCNRKGIEKLKLFGNPIKEFTTKDYEDLEDSEKEDIRKLLLKKLSRSNALQIQQ